jgi:hypothetical protein
MQARLQWGASAPIWPTALDPGESDDWAPALMPESPRTLTELGLPEVAATYRPSMSEPAMLVFTTGESPERVAKILARGQPTASGEEYLAATPEMDTAAIEAIAKRMEGVTDPAKLTELTLEVNEAMTKAMAPMADRRIVRDPQGRYFELPASADGQPRRIVGVGRDATLGVTVISVLLP